MVYQVDAHAICCDNLQNRQLYNFEKTWLGLQNQFMASSTTPNIWVLGNEFS